MPRTARAQQPAQKPQNIQIHDVIWRRWRWWSCNSFVDSLTNDKLVLAWKSVKRPPQNQLYSYMAGCVRNCQLTNTLE